MPRKSTPKRKGKKNNTQSPKPVIDLTASLSSSDNDSDDNALSPPKKTHADKPMLEVTIDTKTDFCLNELEKHLLQTEFAYSVISSQDDKNNTTCTFYIDVAQDPRYQNLTELFSFVFFKGYLNYSFDSLIHLLELALKHKDTLVPHSALDLKCLQSKEIDGSGFELLPLFTNPKTFQPGASLHSFGFFVLETFLQKFGIFRPSHSDSAPNSSLTFHIPKHHRACVFLDLVDIFFFILQLFQKHLWHKLHIQDFWFVLETFLTDVQSSRSSLPYVEFWLTKAIIYCQQPNEMLFLQEKLNIRNETDRLTLEEFLQFYYYQRFAKHLKVNSFLSFCAFQSNADSLSLDELENTTTSPSSICYCIHKPPAFFVEPTSYYSDIPVGNYLMHLECTGTTLDAKKTIIITQSVSLLTHLQTLWNKYPRLSLVPHICLDSATSDKNKTLVIHIHHVQDIIDGSSDNSVSVPFNDFLRATHIERWRLDSVALIASYLLHFFSYCNGVGLMVQDLVQRYQHIQESMHLTHWAVPYEMVYLLAALTSAKCSLSCEAFLESAELSRLPVVLQALSKDRDAYHLARNRRTVLNLDSMSILQSVFDNVSTSAYFLIKLTRPSLGQPRSVHEFVSQWYSALMDQRKKPFPQRLFFPNVKFQVASKTYSDSDDDDDSDSDSEPEIIFEEGTGQGVTQEALQLLESLFNHLANQYEKSSLSESKYTIHWMSKLFFVVGAALAMAYNYKMQFKLRVPILFFKLLVQPDFVPNFGHLVNLDHDKARTLLSMIADFPAEDWPFSNEQSAECMHFNSTAFPHMDIAVSRPWFAQYISNQTLVSFHTRFPKNFLDMFRNGFKQFVGTAQYTDHHLIRHFHLSDFGSVSRSDFVDNQISLLLHVSDDDSLENHTDCLKREDCVHNYPCCMGVELAWFVEKCNDRLLEAFMRFITGSQHIADHSKIRVIMQAPNLNDTRSPHIFPSASTCLNTLYIPLLPFMTNVSLQDDLTLNFAKDLRKNFVLCSEINTKHSPLTFNTLSSTHKLALLLCEALKHQNFYRV